MRDIAVPFHDRQRIARERAGKNVDVREHGAERTSDNGGARGGRTQGVGFCTLGISGGNIATGEESLTCERSHDAVCDGVH